MKRLRCKAKTIAEICNLAFVQINIDCFRPNGWPIERHLIIKLLQKMQVMMSENKELSENLCDLIVAKYTSRL